LKTQFSKRKSAPQRFSTLRIKSVLQSFMTAQKIESSWKWMMNINLC